MDSNSRLMDFKKKASRIVSSRYNTLYVCPVIFDPSTYKCITKTIHGFLGVSDDFFSPNFIGPFRDDPPESWKIIPVTSQFLGPLYSNSSRY